MESELSIRENQWTALGAETAAEPRFRTMYFQISPMKLILMSTCTFGLYQLYWYYKQWCHVQEQEKSDLMPLVRAIFSHLFCFLLFEKVQASAKVHGTLSSIRPDLLGVGWLIFSTMLYRLPGPYWLATYLAVLFLVPVQIAANEINRITTPDQQVLGGSFSKWDIGIVVIGGPLFVLMLIGTFFPAK
jgi:hypothetical protein